MQQLSKLIVAANWRDYEVLDCGDGEKLERWSDRVLVRPDPQVIWPRRNPDLWKNCDAVYRRSSSGGGSWTFLKKLPDSWVMRYEKLRFKVRPTGFKHLGLFPEQQPNWDWIAESIARAKRKIALLNLFGYTGGATVAAAAAGADVCHVDAARGMVEWCRENAALCNLRAAPIKYIVDDCPAFVRRELRRGRLYDAIVMDPPAFGRGRRGEVWKLEDNLWDLLRDCARLLSPNPLFLLLNAYAAGLSPLAPAGMVAAALEGRGGRIEYGEIGLPVKSDGRILPCGVYCRWAPSPTA